MKILIIGLGSIARKHIEAARAVDPHAEFYALRSHEECRAEHGVTNIFTKEQARNTGADFAIISNPTSAHRETIEWLAELKIPLFIEKPLSDSLEVGNILSKCDNILTYVACNLRFLECLVWIKGHLPGRRINEVNTYCGSYLPQWREGINWRESYSANKSLGGGVHIDLIHEIDYVYWLFGKPLDLHKRFTSCSSLDIDAYDYANYCMSYPEFTVSTILNYYRQDYKRTLEIVFQDCTWEVNLATNSVRQGGEILFESKNRFIDSYQSQMEYFMQLVKNKEKKSINSINDAHDVLKICLEDETRR